MKITMLTFGTRGDVQPFVTLGKALLRRGHSIRIGTSPAFEQFITAAGLECFPITPPVSMDANGFSQPRMVAAVRKGPSYIRTVRAVDRPTDDELVTLFSGMEKAGADADLLITAPLTHIAAFVSEPVNWCAASWVPITPTREFPAYQAKQRQLGGAYNKLTHKFFDGLQWSSMQWIANKYLASKNIKPMRGPSRFPEMGRDRPLIYSFSPTVVPKPADWPDRVHVAGYWHDDETPQPPTAEMKAFVEQGSPPVVLALGSGWAFQPGREAIDATIAAARKLDRPVVLVGGPDVELPPDAIRTTNVDYQWLLPRSSVIVHHGGCGTAGAAIRAGTPQVAIPAVYDNPFWANRMYSLGVAVRPLPLHKFNTERLTEAMRAAVTDQKLVDRAREVHDSMRHEDGLTVACDVVEDWLEHGG